MFSKSTSYHHTNKTHFYNVNASKQMRKLFSLRHYHQLNKQKNIFNYSLNNKSHNIQNNRQKVLCHKRNWGNVDLYLDNSFFPYTKEDRIFDEKRILISRLFGCSLIAY